MSETRETCGCKAIEEVRPTRITIDYCDLHKAAPEMLEHLAFIVNTVESYVHKTSCNMQTCGCSLCRAKAAIAKATDGKAGL